MGSTSASRRFEVARYALPRGSAFWRGQGVAGPDAEAARGGAPWIIEDGVCGMGHGGLLLLLSLVHY